MSRADTFKRINHIADGIRGVIALTIDQTVTQGKGTAHSELQTLIIMLTSELGTKRRFGSDMDPNGIFLALERVLPEDASERRAVCRDLLWSYTDDFCLLLEAEEQAEQAA